MKSDQLYTMNNEVKVARLKLGKELCDLIDQFSENVFNQCEIRGELLSDEECIDATVVAVYNLLRHTKDYDGQ